MQNRYVGDIGDFGKYGLLRSLSGLTETPNTDCPIRLGVVWYLHPDESHNSDGKFTRYLCDTASNRSKFCVCDPPLYEILRALVAGNSRHVIAVRHSGALPDSTAFYECTLPYTPRASLTSRQSAREGWINSALEATAAADLVFFDPDNGTSEREQDRWRKRGRKHVFCEELRPFWDRGQSIVIYHHLGRHHRAVDQIKHIAGTLRSNLGLSRRPWSLRYRRGTARAFLVVAQQRHESILERRLRDFLASPWGTTHSRLPFAHFESVE